MTITDHAYQRARERMSWNRSATERMAAKALQCGLRHAEASGRLRRYIDKLYLNGHAANNIRIYGDTLFLFKDDRLLTVYQLPKEFGPLVRKCRERIAEGWGACEVEVSGN